MIYITILMNGRNTFSMACNSITISININNAVIYASVM